jgi:hypothetical protein
MDIQCPSCKKMNSEALECSRCGCSLEELIAISWSADWRIAMAQECLKDENPAEALEHAVWSWRLKRSARAAKLAFLANIAQEEFLEALKWRRLCIENANF